MFCKNILFSFLCFLVTLCLISAKINTAEATRCAPLSRFKIDCNTCYCSVDGQRYTCTKRFCTSDVALNFNDFANDQYQDDEQQPQAQEERQDNENWDEFLNDLAVNYDNVDNHNDNNDNNKNDEWPQEPERNENHIDYGDFLVKDDAEYIGSRKHGWRL